MFGPRLRIVRIDRKLERGRCLVKADYNVSAIEYVISTSSRNDLGAATFSDRDRLMLKGTGLL
jgi:hypothetical protein